MADPIGLDCLETLEIKQRLQKPMARRVAFINRNDVRARRDPKHWIGGKGLICNLTQNLFRHIAGGQFLRHPIGQRLLQCSVMKDGAMHQPAQERLRLHGLARLGRNPGPDWVDLRDM